MHDCFLSILDLDVINCLLDKHYLKSVSCRNRYAYALKFENRVENCFELTPKIG